MPDPTAPSDPTDPVEPDAATTPESASEPPPYTAPEPAPEPPAYTAPEPAAPDYPAPPASAGAAANLSQPYPGAPPVGGPPPAPYGAYDAQPPGAPPAYGQPYAQTPPYAGPAYGAPPQYGEPQPYGAAPYAAATQAGGAPGKRPIVLAIIALALAVFGLILAFIPFVTWFSGIFLLAGFVIGLVALISKKQGGKGLSIAAVAVAVVGWIISIVMSIVTFGIIADAGRNAIDESLDGITSQPLAPDATDEPDAGVNAEPLDVVDVGFAPLTGDASSVWYVIVVDNPNEDYVYESAIIDVEAVDASGTILDSTSSYVTALSGKSAVWGLLSVGQGVVAKLNVTLPDPDEATYSPLDQTGAFIFDPLTVESDSFLTTVTGTVSGTFSQDLQNATVTIVVRAADGTIIDGTTTYIDRLPADGTKVQFQALLSEELPAGATFEAYGSP